MFYVSSDPKNFSKTRKIPDLKNFRSKFSETDKTFQKKIKFQKFFACGAYRHRRQRHYIFFEKNNRNAFIYLLKKDQKFSEQMFLYYNSDFLKEIYRS